ncbi:MAG: hypothetical protein KJ613_02285 [Nanoarchaeota archaeon]|nr:hypothetical protein [Nanoarchaeota archaeon]
MNWNECEEKFIRKIEVDEERIASIIEMAMKRLDLIKSIKSTGNNISFIVEGYYEVIKELLVAYLLKNGMKSKNHQCLITYFCRKNPDLEHETNLISQLSYFRNRLDYYGEKIPSAFYERNKTEFEIIIKLIMKLIKE